MSLSFTDLIALLAMIFWPAIPLFWVPVHCLPKLFKRLGFFTYLLPLVTWLPLAFFIYHERAILLQHRFSLSPMINIFGAILLLLGLVLQIWTLVLLRLPGIMGMPEVTSAVKGRMVTKGPFSVVRHPTYLSHTMMLMGVFLFTEAAATGIAALLDFIVVIGIVIPLEERELLMRFGREYEEYQQRVRSRFFPRT